MLKSFLNICEYFIDGFDDMFFHKIDNTRTGSVLSINSFNSICKNKYEQNKSMYESFDKLKSDVLKSLKEDYDLALDKQNKVLYLYDK